jgi:hypothetical protein
VRSGEWIIFWTGLCNYWRRSVIGPRKKISLTNRKILTGGWMMVISGREINYISAQLKMASEAEELGDQRKAEWHFLLAEAADEQRIVEQMVEEAICPIDQ